MTSRKLLLLAALLSAAVVVLLLRMPVVEPDTAPGGPASDPSPATAPLAAADTASGAAASAAATERVAVADPGNPPVANRVQIRGRLIDAFGRPVAGQQIALRITDTDAVGDPRVRVVGAVDRRFAAFATTASADDGTFALSPPVGVACLLLPMGAAIVFRAGPIVLEPLAADRSLGDVVVQAGCVVAGVVRDFRGSVVAGIEVLCGDDGGRFDEDAARSIATDNAGRFRFAGLDNGVWRLRCRSPDYPPQERTVELRPEQEMLDLEFVLGGGGSIRGRVVDDRGAPVLGADVVARSTSTPGQPSVQTSTGTDGSFVLGDLVDSEYSIRASAKGYRRGRTETAAVGTDGLVLQLQTGIALTGIVVDSANTPMEGSRVRAIPASRPVDQDHVAALFDPGVSTDAGGGFTIENLAAGDYRVVSNGRHLDAVVGPVHVGLDEPPALLRIVVDRGAVARITVVDAEGRGVAGARLRALTPDDANPRPMMLLTGSSPFDPAELEAGRPVLRAVSDAAGVAEIWGLVAGTYLLEAGADDLVQDRPLPFAITSGGIDLRVRLERGGFAAVTVVDRAGSPQPGRRIEVEGPLGVPEPGHHAAVSDGAGRARIGPLPAGRFAAALGKTLDNEAMGSGVVLIQPAGGPTYTQTRAEFTVGSGVTATVRLVQPALTALYGVVTGPRDAVADALVQVARQDLDRDGTSRFGLDGSVRSAHTRPDGSFAITDLEPGRYLVRFGRRRQAIHAETEVLLPEGVPDVETALVLYSTALQFVAVRDGNQQPIPGAGAMLRRDGDPPPKAVADIGIQDFAFDASPSAQARSDDRGVVEFADLPPGTYVVEFTAPGYITARSGPVHIDAGTARIDGGVVALRPSARLTGTVVDGTGAPVAAAIVEYRQSDEVEFRTADVRNGRFEIDGLEAGDHVVRARRQMNAAAGNAPTGPELDVHLEVGESQEIVLRVRG